MRERWPSDTDPSALMQVGGEGNDQSERDTDTTGEELIAWTRAHSRADLRGRHPQSLLKHKGGPTQALARL